MGHYCLPVAWEALTRANEVSADLLGLLDKEFCIGRDVPPTTPAPGTKRCRPCAYWRPWGALTEENGVTVDFLGLYLKISMPERSCLGLSTQYELHDLLGMICTICLEQSA